jgi:hypothetical protein
MITEVEAAFARERENHDLWMAERFRAGSVPEVQLLRDKLDSVQKKVRRGAAYVVNSINHLDLLINELLTPTNSSLAK